MDRTILVVDDDVTIVELVADILTRDGYRVRGAYDGFSAIADVDAARPDLAIIDALLPSLNGVTLAAGLRATSPGMPIILMSAVVPDQGLPDVVFIPKPFDIAQLRSTVARLAPLEPVMASARRR